MKDMTSEEANQYDKSINNYINLPMLIYMIY